MPYPSNILDHHIILPYRTPPDLPPPALPCIPWPQDPTVGTELYRICEASPCRTVARGIREDGCVARMHCCVVVLWFGVVDSQA
jgi:hypothetical protein